MKSVEAKSTKQSLIAASMAGMMLVAGALSFAANVQADDSVACYGINKCKGTGDCGGKGSSCAGNNACKGEGFIKLAKDTCLKIQGGSLTPAA